MEYNFRCITATNTHSSTTATFLRTYSDGQLEYVCLTEVDF